MSEQPDKPGQAPEPAVPPVPPGPPPGEPVVPLGYADARQAGRYDGPPPGPDAKNMAMLCHLLAIFTGFLGPLIIWLIKKDQDRFVDVQGKEALNFQITVILAAMCCLPCFCLFILAPIGVLLAAGIQVARIVFCIIATVQASGGRTIVIRFACDW